MAIPKPLRRNLCHGGKPLGELCAVGAPKRRPDSRPAARRSSLRENKGGQENKGGHSALLENKGGHQRFIDSGHAWQGRFRAFPTEGDDHLVTVLRDVERNALRAELVARAEDWKWSSLPRWRRRDPLLWRGEIPVRDERWLKRVNEPLSVADLQRLRHSVNRGRPYGGDTWTKETAARLGLESCLRPRGRPRKDQA